MFWLLLGIVVMFCSALLFQINNLSMQTKTDAKATGAIKNTKSGIAFALFSGLCFGVTAFLNSVVSRPAITGDTFTFAQLLYHSASLVLFSVLVYMISANRPDKTRTAKQRFKDILKVSKETRLPFIAGSMYLAATLLTILSYRMIPNAVAWSITQLNVFWTLLAGVFFFKEINYKRHWLRLTTGVIMAAGACVLLFLAI